MEHHQRKKSLKELVRAIDLLEGQRDECRLTHLEDIRQLGELMEWTPISSNEDLSERIIKTRACCLKIQKTEDEVKETGKEVLRQQEILREMMKTKLESFSEKVLRVHQVCLEFKENDLKHNQLKRSLEEDGRALRNLSGWRLSDRDLGKKREQVKDQCRLINDNESILKEKEKRILQLDSELDELLMFGGQASNSDAGSYSIFPKFCDQHSEINFPPAVRLAYKATYGQDTKNLPNVSESPTENYPSIDISTHSASSTLFNINSLPDCSIAEEKSWQRSPIVAPEKRQKSSIKPKELKGKRKSARSKGWITKTLQQKHIAEKSVRRASVKSPGFITDYESTVAVASCSTLPRSWRESDKLGGKAGAESEKRSEQMSSPTWSSTESLSITLFKKSVPVTYSQTEEECAKRSFVANGDRVNNFGRSSVRSRRSQKDGLKPVTPARKSKRIQRLSDVSKKALDAVLRFTFAAEYE